jgi:DNA repair protein RecO (recombination protein O)
MTDRERVLLETGFVLHQRPYRNSSQLLECFTAAHGRIGLVARGSRRATSRQRALLQPFVPLRLSWVRRGELGRLTEVEPDGSSPSLDTRRLLAAYYSNELLLRLLARGDPNGEVFSCYSRCLAQLAAGESAARTLRLFELRLLGSLGYGLELTTDAASGEPIVPERHYRFELEDGLRAVTPSSGGDLYSGRELISLSGEILADEASLKAAHRLLGRVLAAYLGERPLKSRLVLKDLASRGL